MREKLIKTAHILRYLVKTLHNNFSDIQVGKTLIQKMIYLLTRERKLNLDYTLYHYGPFSREVERGLDKASHFNLLNIEWRTHQGYHITATKNKHTTKEIPKEITSEIKKLVNKYGQFSANKLSIIATALYVVDHYTIQSAGELVDKIISLKPDNKPSWVKEVLHTGGVLPFS